VFRARSEIGSESTTNTFRQPLAHRAVAELPSRTPPYPIMDQHDQDPAGAAANSGEGWITVRGRVATTRILFSCVDVHRIQRPGISPADSLLPGASYGSSNWAVPSLFSRCTVYLVS